jgi:hypothetical protein
MVVVAVLQHTDNALQVAALNLYMKACISLILHSLGSFTGLCSSILNGPDGLLGILLVLGLFKVSNSYKFTI